MRTKKKAHQNSSIKSIKRSVGEITKEQVTKIDRYIQDLMGKNHLPGVVVGVYHNGDVILAKGYGVANILKSTTVSPDMPFCIGSIGKQFVSAAIMMLSEEGKLSLDDSLAKYFPNSPKGWGRIKIKNLLSHTSGLTEYINPKLTGPKGLFDKNAELSEREMAERVKKLPILFEPGDKWEYCNTNYMLLGIIIHEVTGEFYFDFLRKRIFTPLDMRSPRFVHKADDTTEIPSGYESKNGNIKEAEKWSDSFNSTADGVFYCNVCDLAKWDKALYGNKLLTKQSLDKIWTVFKLNNGKPNEENYGFGWGIKRINGHKLIEHGGGWAGFETYIARYVDVGLTVVVLTNLDIQHETSEHAEAMAYHIAGLLNRDLK